MPGGTLEAKVAIVTGASRGIGRAIAERLGAEGATVAVAARTTEAADGRLPGTIHETADAVRRQGGRALAIPTDLSQEGDRERLVARVEAEAGPVDILVNNAAVTYFTPVEQFSLRRYDLMFEVQVKAPFHLARLVLPGMRTKGQGWILNISSGAARHPASPPDQQARGRGGTVYGMCKAAVERFSSGLAAELYSDHIAVNALSPSRIVPTPGTIFHGLVRPDDPDQLSEPPEIMAEAALALCSGDPAHLTGRIAYSQALLEELGRATGATEPS
jgi:NAD(P)-dependent dehydrogenase (short-subunit alcohol dehydrogenase family)